LVAAVRDVPLVDVEKAALGEEIGVAIGNLRYELVAGLVNLGEPQSRQALGQIVDVLRLPGLVAVEVGLAQ